MLGDRKAVQQGMIALAMSPRDSPPWYLRPFRAERELMLQHQALFPMQCDSLPVLHALFGDDGVALQTGDGHFLLWVSQPDDEPDACEFVRSIADPWPALETQLRWQVLLPSGRR